MLMNSLTWKWLSALCLMRKTSRPSVSNAVESVLIHKNIAEKFLPLMKAKLDEKNVTLYGCDKTAALLGSSILPADEELYGTEFLDYTMTVKVVDSMEEAISHIERFGTQHSEAIITNNLQNAEYLPPTSMLPPFT